MTSARRSFLCAVFILSSAGPRVSPPNHRIVAKGPARLGASPDIVKGLPFAFEENVGQTDAAARFVGRGREYNVFLTGTEAIVALPAGDGASVRMGLGGANPRPRITPLDRRPASINYLRGSDPSRWHRNVPSYNRIHYEQVYPGIDLEYYGTDGRLEYDFLVGPGADASRIQIQVGGADDLAMDARGDLTLLVGSRSVDLRKPVAYQMVEGQRRTVPAAYRRVGASSIGFSLGSYDPAQPLVIDPILAYSTYFGGADEDFAFGVAVDGSGNSYVSGCSMSTDFPTTAGAFSRAYKGTKFNFAPGGDAVVLKFGPTGSLIYSTYVGGTDQDCAYAIAVEGSGAAYVTGATSSTDFPTTSGALQTRPGQITSSFGDMFVTKLDPSGSSLVYSTYLAGYSLTTGYGIAVDSSGNAYVTGAVSFTFRTTNPLVTQNTTGGSDAFVAKLNPGGSSLLYAKLLGGTSSESGYGIALDSSGSAYVIGTTNSNDLPTTAGADSTLGGSSDSFVAKLNSSGAVAYSTYLGGSSGEDAGGIAVDGSGNAYVTGGTSSSDFPTTSGTVRTTTPGSGDAYIVKYGPTGSVVYSATLGGSSSENCCFTHGLDSAGAIAVDSAGTAYVVGQTSSNDFPQVGAVQTHVSFQKDGFVSRLNATGTALLFSTYLGGSSGDEAQAIAIDASGNMYIAGRTKSTDLPTLLPAQSSNKGGSDMLIARISSVSKPDVTVDKRTLVFAVTTTGTGSSRTAGPITGPQPLRLAQSGPGAVSWTAATNQPWLSVSPASGTMPAAVTATASVAGGIPAGTTAAAKITFTFTGASTTTATVDVTLTITALTDSPPPIGTVDTPVEGSVLAGSVAVTGWSLDNIGVKRVELWRDPLAGEPTPTFNSPGDPRNGKIFISNATFVDGARPDVEGLYVSMPFAYRAGWGYLMLTWGLYNSGNGVYKLTAFAFDLEDHVTTLGTKSVTFSNNAATKPFGSIDTPAIGGDASGPNFGWGLTPKVNGAATCKIQSNGVQVSIDSGPLQPVFYGDARSDIAGAFAGFSNSAAAGGHFLFDWSTLTNGPHTIGWLITDDCNRADGVGSRYFNVTNGTSLVAADSPIRLTREPPLSDSVVSAFRRNGAAEDASAVRRNDTPLLVARGYGELPEKVTAGDDGTYAIEVQLGGRIEVRLPRGYETAHQVVGGQARGLPVGSSWDAASGMFYWQPAPAFMGPYRLVFSNGRERMTVRVVVVR